MGDFLDADLNTGVDTDVNTGVDSDRFPAVDAYELRFEDEKPPPANSLDRWRRTTVSGAIAGAVALGIQQVFDPEKKVTIGIEQEAPDQPEDLSSRVALTFDPYDSRATSVTIELPEA